MKTEQLALETVVEALVFAAKEPLTENHIKKALEQAGYSYELKTIKKAMNDLESKWKSRFREIGHGFELIRIGGGLCFRSSPTVKKYLQSYFLQTPKLELSRSQLEILAIVAYRQPVLKSEIEEIRGVDCSLALRKLMDSGLVKWMGKSQEVGRAWLYGTSEQFLVHFGLNDLTELPSLSAYQKLRSHEEQQLPLDLQRANLDLSDLFMSQTEQEALRKRTQAMQDEALKRLDEALFILQQADQNAVQAEELQAIEQEND